MRGSVSFSSAFRTSGSIVSSAPPASALAAASRVWRSGATSRSAASAAVTAPAHAVVGDHVLAVRRQRRDGSAGERVGPALALDDEDALPGDLQLALAERLEHRDRPRVALGHQRADRFELLVAVAGRELLDRRPVERPRRCSEPGEGQRESRDEQGPDAHMERAAGRGPPLSA